MTEGDILGLEKERYAAMLKGDAATLEALFDDALTYTHSSGVVDTKASYIAGMRDKVWQYKEITRENERVVIRGGCGLVFCRLKIDLNVRDTPRKVDSNALAVWVEAGGATRLVAVHSAGVPA
jgi:hypothetical protein